MMMIERSGERTRLMILINFLYIFFTFLYINKMNNNLTKKMNNGVKGNFVGQATDTKQTSPYNAAE
jgi:hypothetical protein